MSVPDGSLYHPVPVVLCSICCMVNVFLNSDVQYLCASKVFISVVITPCHCAVQCKRKVVYFGGLLHPQQRRNF